MINFEEELKNFKPSLEVEEHCEQVWSERLEAFLADSGSESGGGSHLQQ